MNMTMMSSRISHL